MVKVIGLTGSIAVGKSTVSRYLTTHGYTVLDADVISKEALNIGTTCYQKVKELFGCIKEDGTVDRKELGKIVFHHREKRKMLEDIIHPYVIEQIQQGIQNCLDDMIFLDIPLLFEAHLEYLCDKIIVVYVDEKIQLKRLMNRNHIFENEALNLMKQQISIEKKKEMGDFVLDNRMSYQELYNEIERVLKVIKDEVIYE